MLKTIKATFLGLVSLAFVSSAFADITFVSWGGAYTASQQKAYVDTWDKGSGVTVENYNGGLGEIKAQVEAGNVTWMWSTYFQTKRLLVAMKVYLKN